MLQKKDWRGKSFVLSEFNCQGTFGCYCHFNTFIPPLSEDIRKNPELDSKVVKNRFYAPLLQ